MLHRLSLTLITIVFPPLTVLLLTGPYTDTLISCILFLCAVIPSHIHAFYISCTYFHRKKKIRKGRYPGGPKTLIYDEKVLNGGADEDMVEELRVDEQERRMAKEEKRRGGGPTLPVCAGAGVERVPSRRNQVVLSGGIPDRRSSVWGEGYKRRSQVNGAASERDQVGPAGYDRRSQISNGVDNRRSILGELRR